MFENIKDITIKGGCFEQETLLKEILSEKINVVYGANGSGKSSIARALNSLAEDAPVNGKFSVIMSQEDHDELQDRVYVFNEDFIDENVKVGDDGMQSIVMLGKPNINDQKALDDIDKEINDLKNEIAQKKILLDGDDGSGKKGLKQQYAEHTAALIKALKNDYAENLRQVKGNKNKAAIDEKVLDDILAYKTQVGSYSSATLGTEITKGIHDLDQYRTYSAIDWTKPTLQFLINLKDVNALLAKVVANAALTQDDAFLEKLAKTQMEMIHQAKHDLLEEHADRCPLCQQEISADWYERLKVNISKVLNEEAEMFQQELANAANVEDIELILPEQLPTSFAALAQTITQCTKDINVFHQHVRKSLATKQQKLYEVCEGVDESRYDDLTSDLQKALDDFEKHLTDYNAKVAQKNKLQSTLMQLCAIYAYLLHQNEFDDYERFPVDIQNLEDALDACEGLIENKKTERMVIEAKLKQTSIALDYINERIAMVFADAKRLRLEPSKTDPGKYILTSRGRVLAPKNVSVGERNILGLAYFFAHAFSNRQEEDRYEKPVVMVIDDPISSFDKGSRSGVLALFRTELGKIQWNYGSKVLVLSHDRQTVKDFNSFKQDLFFQNENTKMWELHKQGNCIALKLFADRGTDYDVRLKKLCKFVLDLNPQEEDYDGIGNQLRQCMEQFAKMVYNLDIKQLLGNDRIWKSFYLKRDADKENDAFQRRRNNLETYIRSNLLRQVVNEQSHAIAVADLEADEHYYSFQELHKSSFCFLMMLYVLQQNHLRNFLRSKEERDSFKTLENKITVFSHTLQDGEDEACG